MNTMSIYEAHPVQSPAGDVSALLNVYDAARTEHSTDGYDPNIGYVVLKAVAGCNLNCKSDEDRFGYECYEYVTDDWLDRPPVMTDEVAWQTGIAMGKYALQNNLERMGGIIHGGEPLFVPRDPENPSQKPHDYYHRILPLIRRAMREIAPQTTLDFSMQTNGTLLYGPNLEMLKEHGVRTSVSLDGPENAHNMNRVIMHNGRRIGTHHLVERGLRRLMQEEYAGIYGGIISVIDIRSDPLEVLAELQRYNPPAVDLHLPYGTWDHMPPGLQSNPLRQRNVVETLRVYRSWIRSGDVSPRQVDEALNRLTDGPEFQESGAARSLFERTRTDSPELVRHVVPYAAWLRTFYEANKQSARPLNVRLFRSIEQMVLGGNSLTEAIGPRSGAEVVVRTDGSIELPDSLRVARNDSEKTAYNVFDHSLEEVAQDLREHHHLGPKTVADACSNCELLTMCGGGHILSRQSADRGFNNPSVYCPDLEDFIRVVRAATLDRQAPIAGNLVRQRREQQDVERVAAQALHRYALPTEWEIA